MWERKNIVHVMLFYGSARSTGKVTYVIRICLQRCPRMQYEESLLPTKFQNSTFVVPEKWHNKYPFEIFKVTFLLPSMSETFL